MSANNIKRWKSPVGNVVDWLGDKYGTVADKVDGVADTVASNVKSSANAILDKYGSATGKLGSVVNTVGSNIKATVDNIGNFFQKEEEPWAAETYRGVAIDNVANQLMNESNAKLEAAKTEPEVPQAFKNLTTVSGQPKTTDSPIPQVTEDSTPEDDAAALHWTEEIINKLKADYDAAIGADGEINKDYEAALGEAYAMYEQLTAMLDQKYNNLMMLLGDQRSASKQAAAINHSKLLKYLPEQLKSMGLGSLGTSQSAFLKAYNMYNNRLTTADQEYRKGATEANDAYMSGLISAMQQYSNAKNSARHEKNSRLDAEKSFYRDEVARLDGYRVADEIADKDHARKKELIDYQNQVNEKYYNEYTKPELDAEEQSKRDKEILDRFATTVFESAEEIDEFIKRYGGQLSENALGDLNYDAEALRRLIEQEAIENAQNALYAYKDNTFKKDVGKDGDTVKINYDNKTAKITKGAEINDAVVNRIAESVDAKQVFAYNNVLYYKDGDGKIYVVEDKQGHDKLYNYIYGG